MISHLNFSLYSLECIFLYCWLNDRYKYTLLLGGWYCIPQEIIFYKEKKPFVTWCISLLLPKSCDIKEIAPQLNETSLSELRRIRAKLCRLILWIWENLHMIFRWFFSCLSITPSDNSCDSKRNNLWQYIHSSKIYSSELSCLCLTWQQYSFGHGQCLQRDNADADRNIPALLLKPARIYSDFWSTWTEALELIQRKWL